MSSGGFSGYRDHRSLGEKIYEAEKQRMLREYEREVNLYLQDLLKDYNDRDVLAINKHLNTLKDALEKLIEGTIDLNFGGSIKKHTYVNGLSDVDVIAKIKDASLESKSPREVLEYFADRIKERLPNTEVSIGKLAVTVKYKSDGHEIQILPAIQTKSGIKISDATTNKWSSVIKPDVFARKLTETNKANNGKVVPVIKILKAINSTLPDNSQLSGYHIESMAVNAFKNYSGRKTYYDMVRHLCNYIADNVKNPIKDSTGQSIHVDDYLGATNSIKRQRIMKSYERVINRINIAERKFSVDDFKEIIED